MRVDLRRILLACVAILCLAGVLGAAAWLFRESLIEALVKRSLSQRGMEAELSVERAGLGGAEIRDVRLTGESGDRLTLSRVNLDYTISGLRARRIDSILVEGGSVRARYDEDGLTVAGFKVGGGGGGAPPVSIGSMEARDVGLTLETGDALLRGEVSVTGGKQSGWRGEADFSEGALDLPRLSAAVRPSRLSFSLEDGSLDAEGALALENPQAAMGAAQSASLDFTAALTGFDPANPFSATGEVQADLLLAGAEAADPAAQARSILHPDMWSGAPAVGGVAEPLMQRLAATLAAFDARADMTVSLDGEGASLRFDEALRLTGQSGPDIRLFSNGGAPALWANPETGDWRANADLAIEGGPDLVARDLSASGQRGRLQDASGVLSLERFGGADVWAARDLSVTFQNRAAGWRARLDGETQYSGELAGWRFDTLALNGAIAIERAGREIHVSGADEDAVRLSAVSLENAGIVQRQVTLTSMPDLTIMLGSGGIAYRYAAAPGAPFRYGAAAVQAESWSLAGVQASGPAGVVFAGQGGDFRVEDAPGIDLAIETVRGPAWTLSKVAARGAVSGDALFVRRLEGETFLSIQSGAARIGRIALENGVAMRALSFPRLSVSGQFLPDLDLTVNAPAFEGELDAAGRTGIALTGAQTRLQAARRGEAPIATQFRSADLAASGGDLPVRMDQAVVAGDYILSDPARADIDIDGARISLLSENPAVRPFTASGGLMLEQGVARLQLSGAPEMAASSLLNIALTHNLSANQGEAQITLPQTRFDPDGLQPQDFINPLRGLVANVDGLVAGEMQASWKDGQLESSGQVRLNDTDFATRFGPAENVSTTFDISSFAPLLTPGRQTIRVGVFNPGVRLESGELQVEMLPGNEIEFSGGWPFAEGRIFVEPFTWKRGQTRHEAVVAAESLNLASLIGLFGNESMSAAGKLSGRVPILIDEGDISVEEGRLFADEDGYFSYTGRAADAAAQSNEQANLAFRALKNFRYRVLEAALDGPLAGEMQLDVLLEGHNPDVLNGTPFEFDITLNADLMNLLRNVTRGRQIERQIREQLGDESR